MTMIWNFPKFTFSNYPKNTRVKIKEYFTNISKDRIQLFNDNKNIDIKRMMYNIMR